MTKREMFNLIATANADNAEIVDFCNHEIALIDERRVSKKPTKTQVENEGFIEVIAEVLAGAEAPMTIAEIIAADERLAGLTVQRVSALLKKMVDTERVVKTYEKKKAFFTLA